MEAFTLTNNFIFLSFRYLIFGGFSYYLFWILLKHIFKHRKIQSVLLKKNQVKKEILYSFSTITIFSLNSLFIYHSYKNGLTLIYTEMNQLGLIYYLFSLLVLIVLHDTYFFWSHKFLHKPLLFKYIHSVHHYSSSPNPLTSFSLHPIEAIIQAMFLNIMIFVLPLHWSIFLIFSIFSYIYNILGHLGFEFFPKGFTKKPLIGLFNTATHHDMHHKLNNFNFGLYFNIWDRLLKTNHKNYDEKFEKLVEKKA